jgi:hypothetical protein
MVRDSLISIAILGWGSNKGSGAAKPHRRAPLVVRTATPSGRHDQRRTERTLARGADVETVR